MRLLGLLLGVGLALGLTMYAIDKVNETSDPAAEQAAKAGLDVSAPQPGLIDAAKAAACTNARDTINAAEEVYRAQFSRFADIPTLVLHGTLTAAPTQYVVESNDGYRTYRLVGQDGCP